MPRAFLVLICVLSCASSSHAQTAAPDGVAALLARLEAILQKGDPGAFPALLSPTASENAIAPLVGEIFMSGVTRAVVRERDRAPLQGVLPGDGYRLVIEVFLESSTRARVITARLDVRRPRGAEDPAAWRIAAGERLTSVDGLYRLSVTTSKQFSARGLAIASEDLQITLHQGSVFVVESADGVTGLVLLGRGDMQFSPTPETERGQVRIFAGSETLLARFDAAFIRISPYEFERRVSSDSLTEVAVDPRLLRRAQEIFAVEAPKSFSLDLSDLSRDMWYLLPGIGDFLAEVRTRRHGSLTYARSTGEAEDVTLFDREKHRNIALYASAQKLSARGQFYDEDDLVDYDVLHYDIDVGLQPEREFIEGRARMRIRVRAYALATLTIRLADPLTVTSVASEEHGRLLHLRVRNQNSVVVNLAEALPRDTEMTLLVAYSGRLRSQGVDREAVVLDAAQREDVPYVPAEPNYLLSNRAFWYPQGQVTDFATGTLRITVPETYGCVASGELAAGSPRPVQEPSTSVGPRKQYVFVASDPLRYFAVVASRFVRVATGVVALAEDMSDGEHAPRVSPDGVRQAGFRVRDRVALAVDANPRQQARGREAAVTADDIVKFYSTLMGDTPYSALTIAMVEHDLPGGHSPGYLVILNNPLPSSPFVWRNDPAAFSGFPAFFLAHELAHQWWGQAVGWKNYHEQWISEGFAQYFAALYAQKTHGEAAFADMLRQFRRWAVAESDQGPVHLGYRLGHIKGETRVFRALLYNKGAGVLHMLRRLVGDEAFFNALRRFYVEKKFDKAGTDDLRRAFEAETGRSFARFFDRWILGATLPRLRYQTVVADREVTVRFQQIGEVFDVPVTVTITQTDGRMSQVIVPVTEQVVEKKIRVEGVVRSVHVNRDSAALAHFDES